MFIEVDSVEDDIRSIDDVLECVIPLVPEDVASKVDSPVVVLCHNISIYVCSIGLDDRVVHYSEVCVKFEKEGSSFRACLIQLLNQECSK